MEKDKYLVFLVGERLVGIEIGCVSIIEEYLEPIQVKNMDEHLLGYIDLRGENIYIVSLRSKFGIDEEPATEETKYVIIEEKNYTIALKVDEIKKILEINDKELYDSPSIVLNDKNQFISKLIHKDNETVFIINPKMIIEEEIINKLIDKIIKGQKKGKKNEKN